MKRAAKRTGSMRFGAVMLALALLAYPWYAGNMTHMLSHELDGVWVTDDPRYQGRSMELSPTFVILVTGPEEPASVQWVDRVQSEPTAEGFRLTVYATEFTDGNSTRMSLQFSRANGGEIRFANDGRLWRRER